MESGTVRSRWRDKSRRTRSNGKNCQSTRLTGARRNSVVATIVNRFPSQDPSQLDPTFAQSGSEFEFESKFYSFTFYCVYGTPEELFERTTELRQQDDKVQRRR